MPTTPKRAIYYHVAGMNHWREIVVEQLGVIRRNCDVIGKTIHIGFTGQRYEDLWLRTAVEATGMVPDIIPEYGRVDRYEFPTLERLQRDVIADPSIGEVTYFHTKGASRPGDWVAMQWRWLMNRDVLSTIDEPMPAGFDAVGSSLGTYWNNTPHLIGNCWRATAAHVKSLPDLKEYAATFLRGIRKPTWMSMRHAAEFWLGSAGALRAETTQPVNSDFNNPAWWIDRTELQRELAELHVKW